LNGWSQITTSTKQTFILEEDMLVLTRRVGDSIVIADDIRITVVSARGDRIRLGFEAPLSVCIERQEVHDRRVAEAELPPSVELSEWVANEAAVASEAAQV
jgi:carbon storage regulator